MKENMAINDALLLT